MALFVLRPKVCHQGEVLHKLLHVRRACATWQIPRTRGPPVNDMRWTYFERCTRCIATATTRMSRWKLGSMVRISGLFHLPINGIFLGVITHWSQPLILTSNGTSKYFHCQVPLLLLLVHLLLLLLTCVPAVVIHSLERVCLCLRWVDASTLLTISSP